MLIKFFRNGQGGGSGPVDYLVERDVVAYDQNRNAIRDERGEVMLFTREPLPEVLRGDADRMRALIDACPHQWTYRAGVIAFTAEDAPSHAQQRQVMDAFESLAFAGLEADQRDMLWVRHTHEGRVELHFVTPRMELASERSLNIAPPGYQKHYDVLRDVLNKEHGWNDPMAPERARETVSLIESVRRGDARELIHDWIVQRIETGQIHDRPSMTEALTAAGFDLPRAGKNYITVRDPETGERWRLKGDLFREAWTRENTLERALERSAGEPSRSGSRLDAIALDELRDRLERSLEARASYNRDRYPQLHGREPPALERGTGDDRGGRESASLDGAAILPDHGRGGLTDHPVELHRELVLGGAHDRSRPERQPLANRVADQPDRQRQSPDLGRKPPSADHLPDRDRQNPMPEDRPGRLTDDHTYKTTDAREPVAAGTRIVGLRRDVDEHLAERNRAVRGAGETLDRHDRKSASGFGRIAEIAHRVTGYVHERLARLRQSFQRHGLDRAGGSVRSAGAGRSDAGDGRAADVTTRSPASDRGRI
ncbi:relaxase/mobilization nuclease domain-containing protein [Brucella anthropi]|uniref:relaxase/mobilization nuclease domain-containing protein n=1 Tax=Brucella anthropi TaxID=529 RepID=UPI00124EE013|nr:relaxase/mobilization nuclease domain-containing protein [Brucella anthropi]KAB2752113.1 relaxase/mobilization nuclease domain-containing protein [Brucella anthropi]